MKNEIWAYMIAFIIHFQVNQTPLLFFFLNVAFLPTLSISPKPTSSPDEFPSPTCFREYVFFMPCEVHRAISCVVSRSTSCWLNWGALFTFNVCICNSRVTAEAQLKYWTEIMLLNQLCSESEPLMWMF